MMTAGADEASSSRRTSPFKTLAILGAILVLAGGLRWYRIAKPDLWLDEIYSIESAMGRGLAHRSYPPNTIIEHPVDFTDTSNPGPWSGIWKTSPLPKIGDVHPPLGYIVFRSWGTVFGYGEMSVRSLSAVASMLCIVLMLLVMRELHSPGVALWACLLMAVSCIQITYAQEAKHYALLQVFALAAALALARIEKRGASLWRIVALFLFSVAMLFTHYFSVGVIVAMGLYALIRFRGRSRAMVVSAFALAGVLFAVSWLPIVIRQSKAQAEEMRFFEETNPEFFMTWTRHVLAAPYRLFGEPLPSAANISLSFSIIYVLPVALIFFGKRRDLLLWTLWFFGTIGIVAVADLLHHSWLLYVPRYTLLASPALCALIVLIPWTQRPVLRYAVPVVAALASLPFLPGAWDAHSSQHRRTVQTIRELEHPGELTIFGGGGNLFPYVQYVTTMHYAKSLPGPAMILNGPVTPSLLNSLRGRGPITYLDDRLILIDHVFPGAKSLNTRLVPATCVIYQFELPSASATTGSSSSPQTAPSH